NVYSLGSTSSPRARTSALPWRTRALEHTAAGPLRSPTHSAGQQAQCRRTGLPASRHSRQERASHLSLAPRIRRLSEARCAVARGQSHPGRGARRPSPPGGRPNSIAVRGARRSLRIIRMGLEWGHIDSHPLVERQRSQQSVKLPFAPGAIEPEDLFGRCVAHLPDSCEVTPLDQPGGGGRLGLLSGPFLGRRRSFRNSDLKPAHELHDVLLYRRVLPPFNTTVSPRDAPTSVPRSDPAARSALRSPKWRQPSRTSPTR